MESVVSSMTDPMNIAVSVGFGLLGFGYLMYGKAETSFLFILFGVALMAYTFVVYSTSQIIIVGIILAILPFILSRFF